MVSHPKTLVSTWSWIAVTCITPPLWATICLGVAHSLSALRRFCWRHDSARIGIYLHVVCGLDPSVSSGTFAKASTRTVRCLARSWPLPSGYLLVSRPTAPMASVASPFLATPAGPLPRPLFLVGVLFDNTLPPRDCKVSSLMLQTQRCLWCRVWSNAFDYPLFLSDGVFFHQDKPTMLVLDVLSACLCVCVLRSAGCREKERVTGPSPYVDSHIHSDFDIGPPIIYFLPRSSMHSCIYFRSRLGSPWFPSFGGISAEAHVAYLV